MARAHVSLPKRNTGFQHATHSERVTEDEKQGLRQGQTEADRRPDRGADHHAQGFTDSAASQAGSA